MFKPLLLLFVPLAGLAQDTITFTQLSNRTQAMNGQFIVRDVYANVISTYFKDGQYYTDTFKNQSTHYQTGELRNGLKEGIWKTFRVGCIDTLFAMGIWRHDTLAELVNYYPNGNIQVRYVYENKMLTNESYHVRDGRKYQEFSYMSCRNKFDDYNMVIMDYHSNGMLRTVGRVKRDESTGRKQKNYGTWYYYTRKGKVWKKVDFDNNSFAKTYRRKGKHYNGTSINIECFANRTIWLILTHA